MGTLQIIGVCLLVLIAVLLIGVFACFKYAEKHMTQAKIVTGQIGIGHRRFSKKMQYVFCYKEKGQDVNIIIDEKVGKRFAGRPQVKAAVRQGQVGKQLFPIYKANIVSK